ncbi:MAG: HAD hydrolase-like protein [Bacteroidota bacterium]|nr:HAD hydrolase-like protein [Bacteroidota bacterium]
MNNKFDSIIFDLDGTLWDANQTYLDAWNEVITKESNQIKMTLDDMASVMGWEQKAAWNKLFPELKEEVWRPMANKIDLVQVELARTKGGKLYPGVREGIEKLSRRYELYIVSNCPENLIPAFLEFSDMKDYFMDYEEHGRTKLSKALNIRKVIERNQLLNPVYVGDTESDRKNAALAEVPFIYLTYGFSTITEPPFQSFDTFESLTQFLS